MPLTLNPAFDIHDSRRVNMSPDFMPAPWAFVPGMEDVRAAIADDSWLLATHPKTWLVKSDWIISLIDEIEQSGHYPYNADVKRLAMERLGMPKLTEREYATEGDALSRLIYNAQRYRRSDALLAEGYVPLTEAIVDAAFAAKCEIEFVGGTRCKVRDIGGRRYLMQPRKRKYAVAIQGQPVRLVEKNSAVCQ